MSKFCKNYLGFTVLTLTALTALSPQLAHASSSQSEFEAKADTLLQQAEQKIKQQELVNHITWKRLLHYPDDGNTSRVLNNEQFFVSPQGQGDIQWEMIEMVKSLLNDYQQGDGSVQCRFPARTHWLKQQLNLSLPQADCGTFDQWMNKHYPKDMVMVFVQEYPDSPGSAFAHTLLRIDTESNTNENDSSNKYNDLADSFAINYSVNGNTEDNQVTYFMKSSTGKYAGAMTIEPYLPKVTHYLKNQDRDIWEYSLALTQAEKVQIIRHIWEVKDLERPYYFLTDNCSSEILRFIDVVRPDSHLFDKIKHFVIPTEVIKLMDEHHLLKQAFFYPSDASIEQSKLNAHFANKEGKSNLTNNYFHNHSNINFNKNANNNPVDGNNLQRTSVSLGQSGKHRYAQLGIRVSYHDILDAPSGYRQNMDMETLNLKLRAYIDNGTDDSDKTSDSQKLQLQELMILRGRSYNPINTARKGGSWGIDISAQQAMDGSVDFGKRSNHEALEQEHLVGNIGFEKGVSYSFGQAEHTHELPAHLCYAFTGSDLQFGQGLTNGYRIGVDSHLGCVLRFHDTLQGKLRSKVELSLPFWYNGESNLTNVDSSYIQPTLNLAMQYDVKKNHSIRLEAEKQLSKHIKADTKVQLGWQWYY